MEAFLAEPLRPGFGLIETPASSGNESGHTSALASPSPVRGARPPSVVSSAASSSNSVQSTYSISSHGSNTSCFGRERRRGRRKQGWRSSPYPPSQNLETGSLATGHKFFCTFPDCKGWPTFSSKYEWMRHEAPLHVPRETWTCLPCKEEDVALCPFCGVLSPNEEHMAFHNSQRCRSLPKAERTFFRKDQLVQHLHGVHFACMKHATDERGCRRTGFVRQDRTQDFGCFHLANKSHNLMPPLQADDPALHCGFCGATLPDWEQRCDHVASHFAEGEWTRGMWWPERRETDIRHLALSCSQAWSCRFLKEMVLPLQFTVASGWFCYLCDHFWETRSSIDWEEHTKSHHNVRGCSQGIYPSFDAFYEHLKEDHGAELNGTYLRVMRVYSSNGYARNS